MPNGTEIYSEYYCKRLKPGNGVSHANLVLSTRFRIVVGGSGTTVVPNPTVMRYFSDIETIDVRQRWSAVCFQDSILLLFCNVFFGAMLQNGNVGCGVVGVSGKSYHGAPLYLSNVSSYRVNSTRKSAIMSSACW